MKNHYAPPSQAARVHERHLFRSAMLKPWNVPGKPQRFKYGWILSWDGIYWHNSVGIKGDDFNNGNWLGGSSWHRGFGPFAVCRYRRRDH